MDKAEQILEKHINENYLNFIFHEKKDLWQELLNATNEALGLAHVVGRSEQLVCDRCKQPYTKEELKVGHCFNCGEQDL